VLNPQQVSELMLAHTLGPQAHQLVQTQYRFDIAHCMNLAPGSRILEIGCGQGDMTAVLANQVGTNGKVIAVDPASPNYGTPFTLAQSTDHLKSSILGSRIEFHLNQDPLEPGFLAARAPFDAVVLAHCVWYFPNRETIQRTLANILSHTSKLFIAEWLLEAQNPAQQLHFFAATLQSQANELLPNFEGNIRTPLSGPELTDLINSAGWKIEHGTPLDTSTLPDARWEVEASEPLLEQIHSRANQPPIVNISFAGSLISFEPELLIKGLLPLPAILISAIPND
jgi:ubiquinone/menaquinone biosynthesis C-methylase UbiE